MTDAGGYLDETVWNEFNDCPLSCADGPLFGATGRTPSTLFTATSYQSALSGFAARTTSDVAYNADSYTAVLVYFGFLGPNSGVYGVSGTSASAPQWAGIAALVNQARGTPVGFLNPKLYSIAADPAAYALVFRDITIGNHALSGPGFSATVRYDLPTGLGSPKVDGLINLLASP